MPFSDTIGMINPAPAHFEPTQWSVVLAAAGPNASEAGRALEKLCRDYWPPLYTYARRNGYSVHDAEDLTQGFFEQLLEKNYLGSARPEQGRFRSFLLASFKNFAKNDWNYQQRQKRGGGTKMFSIEEAVSKHRCDLEPPHHLTPDKAFDRRWAWTVVGRVLERLRSDWTTAEKGELFEDLKPFLEQKKGASHAQIAAKYGITENTVTVAISRLRKDYRELLRKEISRTVRDPADIEEELRYLVTALGN